MANSETDNGSFNFYLESMDHEFSNIIPEHINVNGYKVDGKHGIKVFCDCRTLKSIDYFRNCPKKGFLFVEFSDLIKQDSAIKNKIERISSSKLDKSLKKELKKKFYKEIHQELVTKFKDSINILDVAKQTLTDCPETFSGTPKYIVVVAPFNNLEESKKMDVIRVLDRLKNNVTQSLPSSFFSSVHVIPLNIFCN